MVRISKYGLFFALILAAGMLCAEPAKERQPAPNSFVSEAVYSSTNTSAASAVQSRGSVVVSTRPVTLHCITINYAGTAGSYVEVFNSQWSTGTKYADGNDLQKIAKIDATSKVTLFYDIFMSSGFSWSHQGDANITASYREK